MTAHTCTTLDPSCYRCDLNVDELAAVIEDTRQELDALRTQEPSPLRDSGIAELTEELAGLEDTVAQYRAAQSAQTPRQGLSGADTQDLA